MEHQSLAMSRPNVPSYKKYLNGGWSKIVNKLLQLGRHIEFKTVQLSSIEVMPNKGHTLYHRKKCKYGTSASYYKYIIIVQRICMQ